MGQNFFDLSENLEFKNIGNSVLIVSVLMFV